MSSTTVDFFWDPASPYTYLAATQIDRICADTGATFNWKPFLIGAVFKATGNGPPIQVKAKGAYMPKDLGLWAKYFDVPLSFPNSFPINSITPTRFALAAAQQTDMGKIAQTLMTAHWGEGKDITQPEVLTELAGTLGINADDVTAAMGSDEVKAQLRANTDEAIERGTFGAPTFFIGDTMFWGNDRLALIEAHLKGKLAL